MSTAVEVVQVFGEELAVAVYGRCVITVIRGPVTVDFLNGAFEAGSRLKEKWRSPIGSLTMVSREATLPDGPARRRARQTTGESNAWIAAGATVVVGEGFRASTIRSIVLAVTVFTAGPPRKVFSDIRRGVTWLYQRSPPQAELEPLVQWSEAVMGDSASLKNVRGTLARPR
jgi:hypothetical protein